MLHVAELTSELLDLCRRTQMAYLESVRLEPKFQIDPQELVEEFAAVAPANCH
jgi:hypothetical protein